MRTGSRAQDDPSLSQLREAARGRRRTSSARCATSSGAGRPATRSGANMMTRNSYALNMGYVMERAPVKPERAILEANMGGDKKPSFEYFQSGARQDGRRRGDADRRGDAARAADDARTTCSTSPGPGRTARSPRGCSRSRSRPPRRSPRSSRRPARTSAWSGRARWRTAPGGASRAACRSRSASPGSRSATVGGGTTLPYARAWLELLGCAGAGQGLPLRPDRGRGDARARDLRVGRDGDGRLGRILPRPPRARRAALVSISTFPRPGRLFSTAPISASADGRASRGGEHARHGSLSALGPSARTGPGAGADDPGRRLGARRLAYHARQASSASRTGWPSTTTRARNRLASIS